MPVRTPTRTRVLFIGTVATLAVLNPVAAIVLGPGFGLLTGALLFALGALALRPPLAHAQPHQPQE